MGSSRSPRTAPSSLCRWLTCGQEAGARCNFGPCGSGTRSGLPRAYCLRAERSACRRIGSRPLATASFSRSPWSRGGLADRSPDRPDPVHRPRTGKRDADFVTRRYGQGFPRPRSFWKVTLSNQAGAEGSIVGHNTILNKAKLQEVLHWVDTRLRHVRIGLEVGRGVEVSRRIATFLEADAVVVS